MDSAQRLLFGRFPRAVGVTTPGYSDMELRQYLVHSKTEFDSVIEKTEGRRNLYSSLSAYEPVRVNGHFDGSAVVGDKVSIDFDSSAKAPSEADEWWQHPLIPEFASDVEVIEMMRDDPEVLNAVLEDVCYNARKLATACIEKDIPIIGVFSGLGIHVHQLREVTKSRVGDKMLSTCNRWVSELGLSCADEKASGRPFRIMRIPNVERICHQTTHADGEPGSGFTSEPTGIYQIPLKAAELAQIRPRELLDLSACPRPDIGSEPPSRPELKVQEEYLGPGKEDGVGQEKMRPIPTTSKADDFYKELVKDIVQMPCVYERALGRNPPNDVRVKLGIMLLNADYSVEEANRIISKLNWVDYDSEVTRYQLESLKESGKGDWSCKTMQAKGLCTRADEKEECPTYGYQGGNVPWGQ